MIMTPLSLEETKVPVYSHGSVTMYASYCHEQIPSGEPAIKQSTFRDNTISHEDGTVL